jgi:hypothetical protein
MISRLPKDLWSLVHTREHLDPSDLTAAIEDQVRSGDLDYRTCVLIRDSVKALRSYWGETRLSAWLETSPVGKKIEEVCNRKWDDDRGFPSLMRRVMDVTRPETIEQFLRELGMEIPRPLRVDVGGSASLILGGYLLRKTEDIDVVDEVPAEIRSRYKLLEDLQQRYGLGLTHFQRHYLPAGWEQRLHSRTPYGQLQVYLVDVYDVFLSKLFSDRDKDRTDVRFLYPQLDKETVLRKLKETTQSWLAVPDLLEKAERNWYVFYGEPLPS